MFRTTLLCGAVLASLVSCKHEIKWEDQKITTYTVGPFSAPIPAGWRDIHELADKGQVPKTPGPTLLLEHAETDLGFQANIIGMWGTPKELLGTDAAASCDDLAKAIITAQKATLVGAPTESTSNGDRVCTATSTLEQASVLYRFRFHGDHALFVQCMRATRGDAAGDAGCAAVWDALKLKP